MVSQIKRYIDACNVSTISRERRAVLQPLVDYLQRKRSDDEVIRLNFICTHNSRRSLFAQVWAQAMAYYYGISNLECFSGGTESTALFYKVADTLETVGFKVEKADKSDNPKYEIAFSSDVDPIIGYSKTWDDSANPSSGFAAVMTCSHADENCPFILGAEERIPITYDDPKAFDNTPEMTERYAERCRQIATEMRYVFGQVSLTEG